MVALNLHHHLNWLMILQSRLLSRSLTTELSTVAAKRRLSTSFAGKATAMSTIPGNPQPTQKMQLRQSRTTGNHCLLVSALLLHQ